ncbi:transcription activator of gluconeogenesis ERT1 [Mycena olivaceomarginata]|nr:transcription activator of gluconeogenesis ERT1 [Mycena olivaceomarginata]
MSAAIRPAPANQSFGNPISHQTANQTAAQKQLQPHPGPAAPVPASLKRKPSQIALQNTDDETQDESVPSESQAPRARGRDRPKKKKASRACVHCQKAHLTCDDSDCTEGHRKKAKYLLDEEELEKLKSRRGKSSSAPEASAEPSPVQPAPAPPPPHLQPVIMRVAPCDQLFAPVPFDPSFPFGSEAANLEYSILSAILGNPNGPMEFTASRSSNDFTPFPDQQIVQPSDTTLSTSPTTSFLTYPYPQPPEQQEALQYTAGPRFPLNGRPRSPRFSDKEFLSPSQASGPSFAHANPMPNVHSGGNGNANGSHGSQLQNINDRVTMPYDYTEGYHFLMKHLPSRFEKNDILRVVRALAIFRPSLIALQMPLSFDDEVFCGEVLPALELDKLISFSGTPTVVWRRTGEICLVAPEFCMLTEWSLDELVGRKKYIYELFENQSVVEYWENFASHAFENTTQSVYSHCVLLKPNGAPVPSTFCFSIRRDLFDLPSVVIGQWLPLL